MQRIVAVLQTVGNTSLGVAKYYNRFAPPAPTAYISLSAVPELNAVDRGPSSVSFGAAVTLTTLRDELVALSGAHPNLAPLAAHLKLVAHPQVRAQL
eukprot:SAG22_NODE_371_length_11566_cov_5.447458_12_plen_97_part_00